MKIALVTYYEINSRYSDSDFGFSVVFLPDKSFGGDGF